MHNWIWLIIALAAVVTVSSLKWWDRIEPYLHPRPKAKVRETSGADPKFVGELKAMRNAPVAPELISDGEMDLAWGLIWHGFEAALQDEVDRIFSPVLAELQRPRSFAELRELVAA